MTTQIATPTADYLETATIDAARKNYADLPADLAERVREIAHYRAHADLQRLWAADLSTWRTEAADLYHIDADDPDLNPVVNAGLNRLAAACDNLYSALVAQWQARGRTEHRYPCKRCGKIVEAERYAVCRSCVTTDDSEA